MVTAAININKFHILKRCYNTWLMAKKNISRLILINIFYFIKKWFHFQVGDDDEFLQWCFSRQKLCWTLQTYRTQVLMWYNYYEAAILSTLVWKVTAICMYLVVCRYSNIKFFKKVAICMYKKLFGYNCLKKAANVGIIKWFLYKSTRTFIQMQTSNHSLCGRYL